MKQEFDQFIDTYRPDLDQALALSGESSAYFAHYKAQKLAEWLPLLITQHVSILDFGCGDGLMTHFVSQQFKKAQLYGVDPSPKSIEVAQKNYSSIIFSVNSDQSTQLQFVDSSFDIIFAAGAFHHIPFHLHEGYMKEIKRILKPGGYLVMFELNPLNPLTVRTFKKNPIDFNAKMLLPWYAYRLAKNYGAPRIKFYCFFPKFLKFLRFTESFLTKLPCGALYAVIMKR